MKRLLLCTLLLTGCGHVSIPQYDAITDWIRPEPVPDTPEPSTPEVVLPLPIDYHNAAHTMLRVWKPERDGGGPLVTLYSPQLAGRIKSAWISCHHPDTEQWCVAEIQDEVPPYEDGRAAVRWSRTGAWYGTYGPCHHAILTTDGVTVVYVIDKPGERWENVQGRAE